MHPLMIVQFIFLSECFATCVALVLSNLVRELVKVERLLMPVPLSTLVTAVWLFARRVFGFSGFSLFFFLYILHLGVARLI